MSETNPKAASWSAYDGQPVLVQFKAPLFYATYPLQPAVLRQPPPGEPPPLDDLLAMPFARGVLKVVACGDDVEFELSVDDPNDQYQGQITNIVRFAPEMVDAITRMEKKQIQVTG